MAESGIPFVSSAFSRVSSSLAQSVVLGNLRRQQEEILRVQEQLSSGYRVLRPSDDPVDALRIQDFTIRLQRNSQFTRNIGLSTGRLSIADTTMEHMNDLLNRAREIALSQVQSTGSSQTRALAAQEVTQLLREAVNLANTRYENRYLFGGAVTERAPFLMVGNTVAYVGDDNELLSKVSDSLSMATNVSANEAFGVFSSELLGRDATTLLPVDLDPAVTLSTELSALNVGEGVSPGSIDVTGSVGSVRIDLRIARTVSDVIDLVNAQSAVTGVTAALNGAGNGLALTDVGAGTITVQEVLNGSTAADLGIETPSVGTASPLTGLDLDPLLTSRTLLGDLFAGAGIDPSGMVLTQTTPDGVLTATLDSTVFAATNTVEQLLNSINSTNLFLDARISESGEGIDLVSRLSGSRLTIAENGGTTAATLGLLSSVARAKLSDLNGGLGVASVDGSDFRITLKDGTLHLVDVDSVTTVQELVTALDNLAGLDAVINGVGGITLTDVTAGLGSLTVEDYNGSFAATNLGISGTTAGATIVGSALSFAGEQVEGVFTVLLQLRAGLQDNDTPTINVAGRMIDRVQQNLLSARTDTGARIAHLELATHRLGVEMTELEKFRSNIRDLDFAEAATRFQIQQTVLESSLAVAARVLRTTIFDYL